MEPSDLDPPKRKPAEPSLEARIENVKLASRFLAAEIYFFGFCCGVWVSFPRDVPRNGDGVVMMMAAIVGLFLAIPPASFVIAIGNFCAKMLRQ